MFLVMTQSVLSAFSASFRVCYGDPKAIISIYDNTKERLILSFQFSFSHYFPIDVTIVRSILLFHADVLFFDFFDRKLGNDLVAKAH